MSATLQFVLRHGSTLVFLMVLVEQAGLPIPAVPILLAAGALAGSGRLSLSLTVLLAVAAALIADSAWYQLGRHRGSAVLALLCRISLEPDSCVRRTEKAFARNGARYLLVAKFIPGLGTAASTMAGMLRMRRLRFLALAGTGGLLWAATFTGIGFLFSAQLDRVVAYGQRLGSSLALLVGGLAAYVIFKYYERRKFIRKLRIARITPEELKQKLEGGEDVVVIDLRSSFEFANDNSMLPGAIHLDPEEIGNGLKEVPHAGQVVLYCT